MRNRRAFRPSSLDELETRLVPSAIHLPHQIVPPDVVTSLFKSDRHGQHTKWGDFIRSIGKDFNSSIIKPINHAYQNHHHRAVHATATRATPSPLHFQVFHPTTSGAATLSNSQT